MTALEQSIVDALKQARERLPVATIAERAAETARVVLPSLRDLERAGVVRNESKNPQRTEWRYVSNAERTADEERAKLRAKAKSAAKKLRALGIESASAERGAIRVSLSADDADRVAAILLDLGTCDEMES